MTTMLMYCYGFVPPDTATTATHLILEAKHNGESWQVARTLASCTTTEAALAAGRLLGSEVVPCEGTCLEPLTKRPITGFARFGSL